MPDCVAIQTTIALMNRSKIDLTLHTFSMHIRILLSLSLQDVRDAFPDLVIANVTMGNSNGHCRPGQATVTLANPEMLDDWPKIRMNAYVGNKEVSVSVGASDGWLCVAKLPLDVDDSQFFSLASAYGKVKEAFIMISEVTGIPSIII